MGFREMYSHPRASQQLVGAELLGAPRAAVGATLAMQPAPLLL